MHELSLCEGILQVLEDEASHLSTGVRAALDLAPPQPGNDPPDGEAARRRRQKIGGVWGRRPVLYGMTEVDALATTLLALRGFTPQDFAQYHPGGALGKQLYLRVSDLYPRNQVPRVTPDTPLQDTILEMTAKCLGATAVLDTDDQLRGIITDGDLRRLIEHEGEHAVTKKLADLEYKTPITIQGEELLHKASEIFREKGVDNLIVMNEEEVVGQIDIQDLT